MASIKQGTITSLTKSGTKNIKANVTDIKGMVTLNAIVPERLQAEHILEVGSGIAFVIFDDNTSLIFGRLDGVESAPSE